MLGDLGRLAVLTGIVLGVVVSFAVGVTQGLDAGLVCILGTASFAATSVPLFLGPRRTVVEPIWLVLVSVGLGVAAKSFYVCLGPEKKFRFLMRSMEVGDLIHAALFVTLGLSFLSLGYVLGRTRLRSAMLDRLTTRPWITHRLALVVTVFVAVGVVSFLIFVLRSNPTIESLGDLSSKRFNSIPGSRFRGSMGYLRWGATLLEISFYLVFSWWIARRDKLSLRWMPVAVMLGLAALSFPIFVSSRMGVFLIVLRSLLLWICLRGEPRFRWIALVAVLLLLVGGSMLALRRGAEDLTEVRSQLGVSNLSDMILGSRQFLDLTKTAHILEGVPEKLEFQYGKTLVTWMVAPVPRSQWPEKPATSIGIVLGPLLLGTPKSSGVPPGIVGEMYLNFGLPGIVIGLLALGFFLRMLYETFRNHISTSAAGALIYVVFTTRFGFEMIGNAVSGSTISLLQEMLPIVAALWFVTRPGRQSSG